jgi:Domain of unknown function (DUF4411)
MKYVFDTSSLRALQHFYPNVFKSIWKNLDLMADQGDLISTREAYTELENQSVSNDVLVWAKLHKHIFLTPQGAEMQFVTQIFQVAQFQALISKQATLRGTPVADPFIIACAKIHQATVVTEEGWDHTKPKLTPKQNAAKIPNVCHHFGIPCVNLQAFMQLQTWTF